MHPPPVRAPRPMPSALSAVPLLFRVVGRLAPGLAGRLAWRLFTTPIPRPRPLPDAERLVLDLAEAVDVPFEGRVLKAYRWGPEGPGAGGRTVLLVHGWADRAGTFAALVPVLRGAGFTVVAFDGPAHGASPGRRTELPDFARAMGAVADAVGGADAIVGHSFGAAAAALAVEGAAPVGRTVATERLVLIGGPDRLRDVLGRFARLVRLPERAEAALYREVDRRFGQDVDDVRAAASLVRAGVPTLVVHDQRDREIPFADGEALGAVPGVELLATDGLGHRRVLRDPDVLAAVASFLLGGSVVLNGRAVSVTPLRVL